MFKFLKACYGSTFGLTQLSSNRHLNTASSACCKTLLYITGCPNFVMWHCFVLYCKECLTRQPFFYITRHFENNATHSGAPSSYVPRFLYEIVLLRKSWNTVQWFWHLRSGFWQQVSRGDWYYKLRIHFPPSRANSALFSGSKIPYYLVITKRSGIILSKLLCWLKSLSDLYW